MKQINQIELCAAIMKELARQIPGIKTDAEGISIIVRSANDLCVHFNACAKAFSGEPEDDGE